MTKTVLVALSLAASFRLGASTFGGVVRDSSGLPVGDAKVTVVHADDESKQDVFTGTDGRFALSDDASGQYIFSIQKSGFGSVYRMLTLEPKTDWKREFTMLPSARGTDVEVVATPADGQTKTVPVGGQVAQANLITKVQPRYPVAAKQAGVQGSVELMATISKDGVPLELRVTQSPDDELSVASLDAVRQWRYRPTLLNGEPVAVVTKILVNFTLAP